MNNQENYTRIITDLHISENGGQEMENDKTPFSIFLDVAKEERATDPSYYLLTERESELLNKAGICFDKAYRPYAGLGGRNLDKEETKEVISDTVKNYNKKRLPINKLRKLAQKAKTSPYWSISKELIQYKDKNGIVSELFTTNYIIRLSTQEEESIISLEDTHPFFKAGNMRERVKALGLSDLYLYVPIEEFAELKNLCKIFAVIDAEQEITDAKGMIYLKSAPEFDFFVDTSKTALIKATEKEKRISTGEQITITELLTNQGLTFETESTVDEILAFKDPNTDKLFKQVMYKAIQTKQPAVEITLDEFLQIRGLKNTKDAKKDGKKNLIKATEFLCELKIKSITKKGNRKVGNTAPRVFRDRFIPEDGTRNFFVMLEFDNVFFNNLINNNQVVNYPMKIFKIPNYKKDSYFFACKFLLRKRMQNNHNRELDNRLSVKSLLDVSTITPYEYLSDKGQFKQLIIDRFEKAFDFLEQPEEKGGVHLFSYYFSKARGEKLTRSELNRMYSDYQFFESLYVNVTWFEDIDYSEVHDKHKKHDAKREAAKDKATATGKAGESKTRKPKTEQKKPTKPAKSPFEGL